MTEANKFVPSDFPHEMLMAERGWDAILTNEEVAGYLRSETEKKLGRPGNIGEEDSDDTEYWELFTKEVDIFCDNIKKLNNTDIGRDKIKETAVANV